MYPPKANALSKLWKLGGLRKVIRILVKTHRQEFQQYDLPLQEGEKGHQSIQVVDNTLESVKMDPVSIMERLQTRFLNLLADMVANLAMREMDKWVKKKLGELK